MAPAEAVEPVEPTRIKKLTSVVSQESSLLFLTHLLQRQQQTCLTIPSLSTNLSPSLSSLVDGPVSSTTLPPFATLPTPCPNEGSGRVRDLRGRRTLVVPRPTALLSLKSRGHGTPAVFRPEREDFGPDQESTLSGTHTTRLVRGAHIHESEEHEGEV